MVNNRWTMLTHSLTHTHIQYSITSCMAPSCNMNFHLFSSLGAVSQEKFWAANVLLMEGVNSPGLCSFLWHKRASWTDMQQWDTFFCLTGARRGRLIPIAQGKCICLRLKECSYCLFISLFSLSLCISRLPLSALWHLQSFLPAFCFSIAPTFSLHLYLSPSVSSSHACNPALGYCFSNLADRGQYLCIVFQYPFLVLSWALVSLGHKSTAQTHMLLSPSLLTPVCF